MFLIALSPRDASHELINIRDGRDPPLHSSGLVLILEHMDRLPSLGLALPILCGVHDVVQDVFPHGDHLRLTEAQHLSHPFALDRLQNSLNVIWLQCMPNFPEVLARWCVLLLAIMGEVVLQLRCPGDRLRVLLFEPVVLLPRDVHLLDLLELDQLLDELEPTFFRPSRTSFMNLTVHCRSMGTAYLPDVMGAYSSLSG